MFVAMMYAVVICLGLFAAAVLGFLHWDGYRRAKYKYAGISVWTVDVGETERIAAWSRQDAIDWYLREYPKEWPRKELEDAFEERPTSLYLKHWKDVYNREDGGKQTLRESLIEHLDGGGEIPFLISTTCW